MFKQYALSAALRSVLLENTEDSWLKLFMLPKCLLLTPKRRGRHHKPISIEYLCDLWLKGQYGTLWQRAIGQTTSRPSHSRHNDTDRRIHTSVALAREGLYGKACQVLTSSGLAPQNNDTWELLLSKHPKGPPPTPPTACSSWTAILPKDFNIGAILRSFPKTTVCGPSGLRIQHLIDAAEVHLQVPICSSLRDIINLLASGEVPVAVSKHLAGGSLTALVKSEEDFPLDIHPIAFTSPGGKMCLCS